MSFRPFSDVPSSFHHFVCVVCLFVCSQAMEEYKKLEGARLKCFKKCETQTYDLLEDFPEDVKLRFYHVVISRGACIEECEELEMGLLPWGGITHYVFRQLNTREGFNYLQMAFYKVGMGGPQISAKHLE